MVVHHTLFFLQWKSLIPCGSADILLDFLGPVVRIIFISLVGVSSWLWFLKYTNEYAHNSLLERLTSKKIMRPTLKRALHVGSAAVIISIVRALFVPGFMIEFGVLHLIAASVILIVPFLCVPRFSMGLGVILLYIGWVARSFFFIPHELSWFIWSNFPSPTLDYFPILPWFGFVLIGLGIGNIVYGMKPKSIFHNSPYVLDFFSKYPVLSWIGRNALVLYVLQLPIIILGVELVTFVMQLVIS